MFVPHKSVTCSLGEAGAWDSPSTRLPQCLLQSHQSQLSEGLLGPVCCREGAEQRQAPIPAHSCSLLPF